jgi:hypothetical protein
MLALKAAAEGRLDLPILGEAKLRKTVPELADFVATQDALIKLGILKERIEHPRHNRRCLDPTTRLPSQWRCTILRSSLRNWRAWN